MQYDRWEARKVVELEFDFEFLCCLPTPGLKRRSASNMVFILASRVVKRSKMKKKQQHPDIQ